MFVLGLHPHRCETYGDKIRGIEQFILEIDFAGFDPGNIQQVGDDFEQMFAGAANVVGVIRVNGFADGPSCSLVQSSILSEPRSLLPSSKVRARGP